MSESEGRYCRRRRARPRPRPLPPRRRETTTLRGRLVVTGVGVGVGRGAVLVVGLLVVASALGGLGGGAARARPRPRPRLRREGVGWSACAASSVASWTPSVLASSARSLDCAGAGSATGVCCAGAAGAGAPAALLARRRRGAALAGSGAWKSSPKLGTVAAAASAAAASAAAVASASSSVSCGARVLGHGREDRLAGAGGLVEDSVAVAGAGASRRRLCRQAPDSRPSSRTAAPVSAGAAVAFLAVRLVAAFLAVLWTAALFAALSSGAAAPAGSSPVAAAGMPVASLLSLVPTLRPRWPRGSIGDASAAEESVLVDRRGSRGLLRGTAWQLACGPAPSRGRRQRLRVGARAESPPGAAVSAAAGAWPEPSVPSVVGIWSSVEAISAPFRHPRGEGHTRGPRRAFDQPRGARCVQSCRQRVLSTRKSSGLHPRRLARAARHLSGAGGVLVGGQRVGHPSSCGVRGPCASRVTRGGTGGENPVTARSAVRMSSGRTAGVVCRTTTRSIAHPSSSTPVHVHRRSTAPRVSKVRGPVLKVRVASATSHAR